jgi:hypothetical protein
VQLFDTSGNVGTSFNKGSGYQPRTGSAAGDPKATLTPALPSSGFYRSSPTIGLDKGGHVGAAFQYDINSGPFQDYTNPFALPSGSPDSGYDIVFQGTDGSGARAGFGLDSTAPKVAITTGNNASLQLSNGSLAGTSSDQPPTGATVSSGVATVTVHYASLLGGTTNVNAQLKCDPLARDCTWTASLPGVGVYNATATAKDAAGNTKDTSGPTLINVVP